MKTSIWLKLIEMAGSSTDEECNKFVNKNHFPAVIDGKININQFIKASIDLVQIVDCLGTVFAPVKYDMQGNISKIQKQYKYDENSCLLELMLEERANGKPIGIEATLWLNRALLFFELAFQEIVNCLRSGNYDVNMKQIFTVAYNGSVKQYHNWVTQQLFVLICKLSPTLPQVMKIFQMDEDIKMFERKLENFNITLHLVRCKIDDFFRENDLIKGATKRRNS